MVYLEKQVPILNYMEMEELMKGFIWGNRILLYSIVRWVEKVKLYEVFEWKKDGDRSRRVDG